MSKKNRNRAAKSSVNAADYTGGGYAAEMQKYQANIAAEAAAKAQSAAYNAGSSGYASEMQAYLNKKAKAAKKAGRKSTAPRKAPKVHVLTVAVTSTSMGKKGVKSCAVKGKSRKAFCATAKTQKASVRAALSKVK